MKKLFIILLILLPLIGNNGQVTQKSIELLNSLYPLVKSGDIDQAVKNTIEVGGQASLIINGNFAIALIEEVRNNDLQWTDKCNQYFRKLSKAKNPKIDEIIWPLISWLDISEASSNKDKIRMVKAYIEQLPPDTLDWKTADVYSFLILKNMEKNKLDNNAAYRELFNRQQTHLLNRFKNNPKDNRNRYFLSYSWYYLSQKNPAKIGDFLSKAAEVSPDLDQSAYFYDMMMLDYNLKRKGFRKEYCDYLIGTGREDQALKVFESIAVQEPFDTNLDSLKLLFQRVHPDRKTGFADYWYNAVSSICEPLPVTSFKNKNGEEIMIWSKTGKWTYIDVWGTWCRPCVAEIPDLQELYTKNLKTPDSPLAITTWAYDDPIKMETFMKEKGYTFPVILIAKDIEKTFQITGYPTKILITPSGKYLKIPFNVDWKQYLTNYVGMK
jgi:thiol-disulfide isomerase/thioredoxin